MMDPDERTTNPDPEDIYPVKLWLFREDAMQYWPINVRRFFTVPGRVIREQQRLSELEKQIHNGSEPDEAGSLLESQEPDPVSFDGYKSN
jgi:hypothetical protein